MKCFTKSTESEIIIVKTPKNFSNTFSLDKETEFDIILLALTFMFLHNLI